MRHRPKYKLPNSRRSSGGSWLWLAVILLAIFAGWIWWRQSENSRGRTAAAARPAPVPAATPRSPAAVPASRAAPPVGAPTPIPPAIPPPAPASMTLPAGQWPRPVQTVFEAQVALIAHGISPGSLDGGMGSQTRAALAAFQRQQQLPATGALDAATREKLLLNSPPYRNYTVTAADLGRLQPLSTTWLGKSEQSALDYESILELVAEKSLAHPALIRNLNPGVDWNTVSAGTVLRVPDASYPEPHGKAALVRIHLSGKTLEAFDAGGSLLAHFPCSIARNVEKRPVGELRVVVVAPNPNYTFDPAVFPESPEARELNRRLVLPPGPNNPVGVAWIGLDRPGYGIHGTPKPEEVGRTESHGCFRLANWNAAYLIRLVTVGTPVHVEE